MVVISAAEQPFGMTSMRLPYLLSCLCVVGLGLAACAPAVPESGAGVGFADYPSYLRQREAELAGTSVAPLSGASSGRIAPVAPVFSTQTLGAAIDAADPAVGQQVSGTEMAANRPRGDAPADIATQSGELLAGHSGISDEQSFEAVAARETIQSDAERLARNRAQYQVIQPEALPQRSGSAGPNIVQFALSTSHAPGVPMYKRSALRITNPVTACAKFASPDLAQEAFLASGGPERDRKGIDPDGDGYACAWDPVPFRAALR